MINRFLKKIKPLGNSSNHVITFYLLGIISIFLNCQILKSSSLIKKHTFNYDNCIRLLKDRIIIEDVKKVCEIINHRENFQNFAYNIFYTVVLVYVLIREVIGKTYFNIKYWFIAHLSAIVFALIGELDIFKFSIDSKTKFNLTRYLIIFIPVAILAILISIQLYYQKIRLMLITKIGLIYLLIYILLRSITANIFIHLHHSFISGVLALCFSDFNLTYNKYLHAIFIGIVVQGLNFFSLSELYIFNISDESTPSMVNLTVIYGIYLFICLIFYILKQRVCKKNNTISSNIETDINSLGITLLPDRDDIISYRQM